MALMTGIRMKRQPSTRCDMRMVNTASAPTRAASGGTNTNRPEMASRMQEMETTPCVIRASSE